MRSTSLIPAIMIYLPMLLVATATTIMNNKTTKISVTT